MATEYFGQGLPACVCLCRYRSAQVLPKDNSGKVKKKKLKSSGAVWSLKERRKFLALCYSPWKERRTVWDPTDWPSSSQWLFTNALRSKNQPTKAATTFTDSFTTVGDSQWTAYSYCLRVANTTSSIALGRAACLARGRHTCHLFFTKQKWAMFVRSSWFQFCFTYINK